MTTQKRNSIILRFIYVFAMRDATMLKAFPYEKKNLEHLENFPEIEKELRKFINRILNKKIKKQEKYDELFEKLSIKICDEINSYQNNHFTFGNAQKLINMVMKQLYISCYNDPKKRKCFKFCHCPMDSQLIKAIGFKDIKWSKIDFDSKNPSLNDYVSFQKKIREKCSELNCCPLEFDYLVWNK